MQRWLHGYAVLVSVCTLLLVITGAMLSSNVSGALFGYAQMNQARLFPAMGNIHLYTGIAVGALILGLVMITPFVEKRSWVSELGWICLLIAALDGAAGLGPIPLAATPGFVHALLAHLLFATTTTVAVLTAPRATKKPQMVQDQGWPSLRGLASATLSLIVLQVVLGSAFRHGAIGVMPHIINALVVIMFVLGLTMLVLNLPPHPSLRPAAITLIVVAIVQVTLGMSVISMGAKSQAIVVMIATVAHTAAGASTLAACLILWIQIRRHVSPAPARSYVAPV